MEQRGPLQHGASFTHVDPFEDTERPRRDVIGAKAGTGFTHVDPFEDTERQVAQHFVVVARCRFTHVDPFEDTESQASPTAAAPPATFHPRRSVRGY